RNGIAVNKRTILDTFEHEIPEIYSVGLTYRFKSKFKTSADIHYENWEATDNGVFTNSYKVGFGVAYDPIWGFGQWYEQIPLRMGFSFRKLPFEVNNSAVNERSFTFGLSIPIKSTQKYLDLSVNYLQRGDLDKHGLQDNTVMFSFGTSGFDLLAKRLRRTGHRDIPKTD
ncbi:MAG: hypothetical protein PHR06_06800, partial [Candidatus Cloacimonetes bacterium]|nr:hypothetical protein [Candidatus Cloacimonadota bacterium]